MLILISPAKSLDFGSKLTHKDFTTPFFSKETAKLSSQLKKFTADDLGNLMKISPKLSELNFERFQKFSSDFNLENSKQSLLVFDGDVYRPIETESFSEDDFDFAQKSLRILSGFYGILKPLDLIKPYRLEMGTDFKKTTFEKNLNLKNLYQFWGNKISKYLDEESKKNNDQYIINLASGEYFSAVDQKDVSAKIINVNFKEKIIKDDKETYKIVGIHAKKARGMMVNFIIKNKITDPEEIKKFTIAGYSFSKDMSDEKNLIFTR